MYSIVAIPLWHMIWPNLCIKNIIVAVPICIPTNIVGRLTFLHFLSSISYLLENQKKNKKQKKIFDDHYSDWCEMIPHCSFNLHFSNNLWSWESFYVALVIYISSLEKCLFRSSNVLKEFGCCCYWTAWAIYIFWRWIPCQLVALLQIFSPILWAVFSFYLWLPLLCKSF